jgi:hypothetical protein
MNIDGGVGNGLQAGMFYSLVGGFVGMFKDGVEIKNCHNTGNVTSDCTTASSQVFSGGIAGGSYYQFTTEYQGCILDSSSIGNITSKAKGMWTWTGGIAGCIVGDGDGTLENTTRIMRCYASGTITAICTGTNPNSQWPYVGGIVGYNYYGALTAQSYFTGTVIAENGSDYTGGIAGYNSKYPGHNSRIEDCWSSGTVQGYKNGGGIVGQHQVDTFVMRCYSRAIISTTSIADAKAAGYGTGGIAGFFASGSETSAPTIESCVALNPSITAANGTHTHRVAGQRATAKSPNILGKLTNNLAYSGMIVTATDEAYPYTEVKGSDEADGEDCDAKPAASVYEGIGWDFVSVWKMGTDGYPALKWQ